jgi:hypothetical protein
VLLPRVATAAAPPHPSQVFQRSILLPAAGAWSIDQPTLSALQGGIDLLAVAAIVGEARHPVNDAGSGFATAAGLALLVANRLVGAPVNAGLAYLVPPGEPNWTSRQEPWLSFSLDGLLPDNGWIGIEGGAGGYRFSAATSMTYSSPTDARDGRFAPGDTLHRRAAEVRSYRLLAERGWALHPHLRLSGGLQFELGKETLEATNLVRPGDAWPAPLDGRTGWTVFPEASLEITQFSWFSLNLRAGLPVWVSSPVCGEAWQVRWESGLKVRIPSSRHID